MGRNRKNANLPLGQCFGHEGIDSWRCALRGRSDMLPRELPNVMHHIGSTVASGRRAGTALEDWKKRLVQRGLHVTEEDHGTQRSLYFEEPNGYVLELTTAPDPASVRDEQARAIVAEWIAQGSRESGVVPTRPTSE